MSKNSWNRPPVFIHLCKSLNLFNIQYLFIYLFKSISTTAAQVTTCFYLLMQITCWLHVVLILIFITTPQPQSIPGDTVNGWVVGILLECNLLIYIYLIIKIYISKRGETDHLYLFTYAKELLIKCAFRFNIQYLFVYLFKAMSTTAVQVTTFVYLLMEITCWLHVLFVLIFMIYLFIYSKWCQQKEVEATTCFYLLMEIGCWLHVVFVLIFIIYLFIYSKRCQQKQVEATTCFYLLMEIDCCYTWFLF